MRQAHPVPRIPVVIRLNSRLEQRLRDGIHRRGDVVRWLEASIEAGLTDLSRFRPGRCRRTRFQATVTRTTVRLDPALLARLDAAVRQVNTTRAALLEAMVEAKLARPPLPPPPSAESQGPRKLFCFSLDPHLEQHFRARYIHQRGDLSQRIAEIVTTGLAVLERVAPGPRRRHRERSRLLTATLEVALLTQLTQAAQHLGRSRAALMEALIAARLNGEI
ncbi:MAG: CopG family transcriptional regulator [Candidatus Competibacteraceae bacterium]